jgi:hypothetical protein
LSSQKLMLSLWELGSRARTRPLSASTEFFLFPWREEEIVKGPSKRLRRPTLDVTLTLGPTEVSQRALIDRGAPRTVFPLGAAVALGIDVPEQPYQGPEFKDLAFMSHTWKAFSCSLTLKLPPYEALFWDAEVDFVLDEGLPFGLLGCEGFLDKWAVSLSGYHTYTVIEPVDALHGRVPIDNFRLWQEEWPDYN